VEGIEAGQAASKDNVLLAGPTGCGKTYLVDLLFSKILKIPTVPWTSPATEAGYVGEPRSHDFDRLIQAAENDRFGALGRVSYASMRSIKLPPVSGSLATAEHPGCNGLRRAAGAAQDAGRG